MRSTLSMIEPFQSRSSSNLGRQTGWTHETDQKLANLARAERIAPKPSVICLWRHAGMARMDEWEAALRSDAAMRNPAAQAVRLGVHFTRGGLYDEILGGPPLAEGLHFIEFFGVAEDVDDTDVRTHFLQRAQRLSKRSSRLHLASGRALRARAGGARHLDFRQLCRRGADRARTPSWAFTAPNGGGAVFQLRGCAPIDFAFLESSPRT